MYFNPSRLQECGKLLAVFILPAIIFFFLFPSTSAAQEVIHFPDLALEAAVREALNRPTGLITSRDMALLRNLEAGRREIAHLSGLEYAVNLESLNLFQNKVVDLKPLSGLTKLRVLNLGSNKINDTGPLRLLTALEELDLSHNSINNIEPLQNLARLRVLHLEGNNIPVLTPLAALKNLEELFLSGNLDNKNISPLSRLTRLQRLMLADGNISDIAFLANLKQLRWLELRGNQISRLEPLRGLTRLEQLSLADNKVEDVSPLGSLRQLKLLDLRNNRLRQITPLLNLRNLNWLELQNNFLELQDGSAAKGDLKRLLDRGVSVVAAPQKLPVYRGNALVAAQAGSGGRLLRTPPENYFTLLNYSAGWRIKSFTVSHEGGKPLDRLQEVGFRTHPLGHFSWYSLYNKNSVEEKVGDFYEVTFQKEGPLQLGLGVQLWPGYADDSARLFYISKVELENVETKDTYILELGKEPLQERGNGISFSYDSGLYQGYQLKTAHSRGELRQLLEEALRQRAFSLELSYNGEALNMPGDLEALLEAILAGDHYLKYSLLSYNIRWSGKPGGGLLLDLRFRYIATKEEEDLADGLVENILREILSPGMNQHQKTRAIYDYVVANVAYDLNYRENSVYAALVKGRAVCQGYAMLLYKMLDKAGIKTLLISGQAGGENHLWNMVNLEGNWYHLDATWDDPVPDIPGRVHYNYYNLTDEQMAATHTWDRTLYPQALNPYPFTPPVPLL